MNKKVSGKHMLLVFDGATYFEEVILHLIVDWKLEQQLIHLKFLENTMKGEG